MYQSAKDGHYQADNSFGIGMMAGQNYMVRDGVMESQTLDEDWDNIEPPSPIGDYSRCEMRSEFVFDSGARYNGQWLNNMRHG